jgi:hypothetical protein
MAVALAAAASAGCASTGWALLGDRPEAVCQVVATWRPNVLFTPDPTKNGKMLPGIAGRLYLFGPEISYPLVGDGSLVVELYDVEKGEPEFLERWEIDPATLARLGKRDMIGFGYTVYLPWAKVSPDLTKLTKVKLRARYQPAKGSPMFTENDLTLAVENGTFSVGNGPPMPWPTAKK